MFLKTKKSRAIEIAVMRRAIWASLAVIVNIRKASMPIANVMLSIKAKKKDRFSQFLKLVFSWLIILTSPSPIASLTNLYLPPCHAVVSGSPRIGSVSSAYIPINFWLSIIIRLSSFFYLKDGPSIAKCFPWLYMVLLCINRE